MTAEEKMYGRWGNYIPQDIRKQFEDDCLEAEQQIAELKELLSYCYNYEYLNGEENKERIKQALKK